VQDRFDRLGAAKGFTKADQSLIGFDFDPDQIGTFVNADRAKASNVRQMLSIGRP